MPIWRNLLPVQLMLLTVLAYYFSMPRLKSRQDRAFLVLILLQAAAMFLAIGVHSLLVLLEGGISGSIFWPFYLNLLFHMVFLARAYWYYLFVTAILRLKPQDAPIRTRVCQITVLAGEAVILSSILTGAVLRVQDGVIENGPLHGMMHFSIFFYVVSLSLLVGKPADRLSIYERAYVVVSQLILLAGSLLYLFIPSHVVSSTSCLISTMILFLAFENPNLYLANRGDTFNMRAFRIIMGEFLGKGKYRILAFGVRDYIDMRGIYGGSQMDAGISLIGRFLVMTYPHYWVFYLRNGRFAILGPESMDWEQIRSTIHERFQAPWVSDDAELDLSVSFLKVAPDSGLDTVDRIQNCLLFAFDRAQDDLILSDGMIDQERIQKIEQQVEVKRSLDWCLEHNRVEIFLQPVMEGKHWNLVGAEVLCRIRDEQGKLISPSLFVPIAEQNGCINLMGEQVLEKTCQFVRDYGIERFGLSWLNVNLSPLQCMKKDLSTRFSMILEQYGVSTDVIHLEITEQSVMDISRLEEQIKTLRGIGFFFSLDDYGSGFSNLSRVKQYPFSNIKLDMSIVWDYIRDGDELLPTIVRAFKNMGFTITAEGIETEEIAKSMSAIGCDFLQGYYFSKPIPLEEFIAKYQRQPQIA